MHDMIVINNNKTKYTRFKINDITTIINYNYKLQFLYKKTKIKIKIRKPISKFGLEFKIYVNEEPINCMKVGMICWYLNELD